MGEKMEVPEIICGNFGHNATQLFNRMHLTQAYTKYPCNLLGILSELSHAFNY